MMNNVTKRRERMEIDRLMTRPTRKSRSPKGADVVLAIPAFLRRQKPYRLDSADRSFSNFEQLFGQTRWQTRRRRRLGGPQPRAARARSKSVEHRRDLLDVDAFLGHAQIMIGDSDRDSVIGNPDAVPDPVDDGCKDWPACSH
jgi:hypothetical protein